MASALPPDLRRPGFLPITTNLFDRCCIAVRPFIAIHRASMRLLESGLPLYVAALLSLMAGFVVIRRGRAG